MAGEMKTNELMAILNSIAEGIEIVDIGGLIKYVNPAFVRITGVGASERVGKNIYEVVPDGLLVKVLKTRRPLLGVRSKPRGSEVECVVNAMPIIDSGEMVGAVLVFQDVSEVLKLTRELSNSTAMVENLYETIGDLTKAKHSFSDLVGSSPAIRAAVKLAKKAAEGDSTVLITGESGTGKEIFANAIHNASRRAGKPFIGLNCAAIPDHLLESELFGYEKGAFTGAAKRKIGMFELAHGGTLFLDEIGEMSWPLQAKLLRFLQEQEIRRVGGTETVRVNVRVIAATNRDLTRMMEEGRFREDLYYRLNVVRISTPPLRERKHDIRELTDYLAGKLSRKLGRMPTGLSQDALGLLTNYSWPGNVRELENVLERAMNLMNPDESLLGSEVFLTTEPFKDLTGDRGGIVPLDLMERQMISRALAEFGTNLEGKRRAAKALNISLATLYNKLKRQREGRHL